MKIIRRSSEMVWGDIPDCHSGSGIVKCKSFLGGVK